LYSFVKVECDEKRFKDKGERDEEEDEEGNEKVL
jgi:hypothetical protein